jgi:hypothetical protein
VLYILFFDALTDTQIHLFAQIAMDLNIGGRPGLEQIYFCRLHLNRFGFRKREKRNEEKGNDQELFHLVLVGRFR